MPSINPLSNALGNLSLNANRSLLDPKQYEGFTVKVGKETSQNGVLGGVLSQDDYDKFKEIVKDPEYDTDSEIDHDFRYIQNCLMCTVLNDRMTEHNFSLNLN